MNKLKVTILVLLVLLGASAGVAKVMRMPQELTFFHALGLGESALVLFGVAQIVGSALLIFGRTRLPGAIVLAASFMASAMMIFVTGAVGFGLFSLLPVAMSGWLIWDSRPRETATSG